MIPKVFTKPTAIFPGAALGLLSWAVPLAVSLAVTPLIVAGLGDEQYGIYALILGFVGYSFNFNIFRSLTRYVAECRGQGATEGIPSAVGASIAGAIVLGVFATAAIGLGSERYLIWVFGEVADLDTAVLGMWLGGLTVLAMLVVQALGAILIGYQRLASYSALSMANGLAASLLCLLLVKAGFGFASLLAAGLLVSVAIGVLAATAVGGVLESRLGFSLSGGALRSILSHSGYVIGYQALGNVLVLLERSLITRELGAAQLTLYVVPMTIGLNLVALTNSATLFLLPAAGVTRGQPARLLSIYKICSKVTLLTVSFAVVTAWVQGRLFLSLWMGPAFAEGAATAFLIQIAGLGAVALSVVIFQLSEGLGRPQLNFYATVGVVGVTVFFMTMPVHGVGIESYAAARLLGFAVWLPLIPVFERVLFGKVQIRLWADLAVKCGVALVATAGTQVAVSTLLSSGWFGLVASSASGIGVGAFILWQLGFFEDILEFIRNERSATAQTD